MIYDLVLFLLSLFVLIKSAQYAIRYSSRLAQAFHVTEFIVSFFIIAFISVFPEGTISIISAIKGEPEFGLATLLGSNIADLSLVFGIVALFSSGGIMLKSQILRKDLLYLVLLLVPIILGYDGFFSRAEGLILVLSGILFFITLSFERSMFKKRFDNAKKSGWSGSLALLIVSLGFLLISAYFTVKYGVDFANDIGMPPFFIGLTIVAIGTCLPELVFSLKAVKSNHDELALGDILGTVIIDATIMVGIIALINPFYFNPLIIYITGTLMFVAAALVILFMKSGKIITKKEGLYLLLFYIFSLMLEFVVSYFFRMS